MSNHSISYKMCLFALLLCCSKSWAVNNTIHFQGRLTDNQGNPIVGPDIAVKFALYALVSEGAPVWDPGGEQTVATNSVGLFSTDIGPIPPNIFSDNSDLYLQVALRGTTGLHPLSPRQKFSIVPYAIQANYSLLAGTAATVNDQAITTAKIQDGAVTSNSLAVNSVNSNSIVDGSINMIDLSTPIKSGMIPSGLIAMFDAACPSDWTRFDKLDSRFPMGVSEYSGNAGGSSTITGLTANSAGLHSHIVDPHSHGVGTLVSKTADRNPEDYDCRLKSDGGDCRSYPGHIHQLAGNTGLASPNTNTAGAHTHSIVSDGSWLPPYLGVVFCRKD